MKSMTPYLNFDGNTREAMTFYQKCLAAQLDIQSFGDAGIPAPPGTEQRVMHARLTMVRDPVDRFGVQWMFNCELPAKG